MSICSYQTSSPTRDKFAGPSFTNQLPSCALLSFCSPVVYPRAGGPSILLFFPLNSPDTWPSSVPSDFLRGVSGSRVAIGRYFTRAFVSRRVASTGDVSLLLLDHRVPSFRERLVQHIVQQHREQKNFKQPRNKLYRFRNRLVSRRSSRYVSLVISLSRYVHDHSTGHPRKMNTKGIYPALKRIKS